LIFFIFLFFTASCAGRADAGAPGLLEPAGVTYDTFIVTREDFAVVAKYAGYVVCHTEPLYFTKSGLPVKSVDASIGARVKEGDPLVTLNTETITKQIAELNESIDETRTRNAFTNRSKELDIQIAALELAEARRGGNETEIARKEYALDKLSLEYGQLAQTQELELTRRLRQLADLNSQLEETVMYAPFDGRVVSVTTYKYGWPQAYRPIMRLADETRLEVLYSGRESLSGSRNFKVTARIFDRVYDVKYVELPTDEYMKYILSGGTPPSRFEIINADPFIAPGQFVELSVIMKEEPDALVVPVNSVYRGESEEGAYESYVYVMENGVKLPRIVELGVSNESYFVVKGGLFEGEEVFVKQ